MVPLRTGSIANSFVEPLGRVANRQAEIMMRVASEFGFTPASRSRISAPPPDQLPLLDLTMDDYEEDPEIG
jgi:phage terminase small subunit